MTSKAALFALLTVWGVGMAPCAPAMAQEADAIEEEAAADELTNRVWVRSEEGGLPGAMMIFLSDGTLVQDSCWETHRLSPWEKTSDTALKWDEDGMEIAADIVTLSADELLLSLKLVGGDVQEQHYAPATVPYLCPDVPK